MPRHLNSFISFAGSVAAETPPIPEHYWILDETSGDKIDNIGALHLTTTNANRVGLSGSDPAMGGWSIALTNDNSQLDDPAPSASEYVFANTNKTYAFWFRTGSPTINNADAWPIRMFLEASPFTSRWNVRYIYNSGDPYLRFLCIDVSGNKVVGGSPSSYPDMSTPGKWFCYVFGHDAANDQIFFFVGDRDTGNTYYDTTAIDSGGILTENSTTDLVAWPTGSVNWITPSSTRVKFANQMLWTSTALSEAQCLGYFNAGEGWKP